MPDLSRLALVLSPILLATLPTALHAHPDHEPETASQCILPPGWSAVAARDPQFVVLGETHGTKEAPAFVSDLVCALAARGDRVLLAVEHSSIYDAGWQEAWALPQEQFGIRAPAVVMVRPGFKRSAEPLIRLLKRFARVWAIDADGFGKKVGAGLGFVGHAILHVRDAVRDHAQPLLPSASLRSLTAGLGQSGSFALPFVRKRNRRANTLDRSGRQPALFRRLKPATANPPASA